MGSLSANKVIPQQNLVLTTEEDWDELIADMASVTASITEGFLETDIDLILTAFWLSLMRPGRIPAIRYA